MICPICKKKHDGSFASGKYCSRSCCNTRFMTNEIKEKISKTLKEINKNKIKKQYEYVCDKCRKIFISQKSIRKDRLKTCKNCKRIVPHIKNIDSLTIFDLSKRTISKILKRAKVGCAICNWNESLCDIHHIIERKNGGSNNHNNLIILCPNHHRMVHYEPSKFTKEYLLNLTIDKKFINWKDFYNKNMGNSP